MHLFRETYSQKNAIEKIVRKKLKKSVKVKLQPDDNLFETTK